MYVYFIVYDLFMSELNNKTTKLMQITSFSDLIFYLRYPCSYFLNILHLMIVE